MIPLVALQHPSRSHLLSIPTCPTETVGERRRPQREAAALRARSEPKWESAVERQTQAGYGCFSRAWPSEWTVLRLNLLPFFDIRWKRTLPGTKGGGTVPHGIP